MSIETLHPLLQPNCSHTSSSSILLFSRHRSTRLYFEFPHLCRNSLYNHHRSTVFHSHHLITHKFDVSDFFTVNTRCHRIVVNSSCQQDQEEENKEKSNNNDTNANNKPPHHISTNDDTVPTSFSSSTEDANPPPKSKKENKWKKRKWEWKPLVQAQEVGTLLFQLGIVLFAMRLLRPGLPLPGSEPKVSTSYVSVPFSDFLTRINNDHVRKAEIDGVHIMFRLRDLESAGSASLEPEATTVTVKSHDPDSLLGAVPSTKRIIYTTTRPTDIKTPYDKMLENEVEFGSPDKRSGGFLQSALVNFILCIILLSPFPICSLFIC